MYYIKNRRFAFLMWTSLILSLMTAPLPARPIIIPLVAKTTEAEAVVIGEILQSSATELLIKVDQVVKGAVPSADIRIAVPPRNIELTGPQQEIGDHVVVFIILGNDGLYHFIHDYQGMVKLNSENKDAYISAVNLAKRLSEAKSDKIKSEILKEMLTSNNEIAQREALLQVISNQMSSIPSEPGVANAIYQLAKSNKEGIAMQAIQTLGVVNSPQSIPLLLDLLDNSSPLRFQAVSRALQTSARKSGLSGPQPDKGGNAISKVRWQDWWHENKIRIRK